MTVAVDLPGHGATPAPAEPASIATLRHGCGGSVARSAPLPPAVLVGHSMGCRVVLEAALRAPEHVAAIVLVDGSRFRAGGGAGVREPRFAAGEYPALVRGMFKQMFTPRSDARTIAAIVERALALPEDVGQAMLLSMVRYDEEMLESRSRARGTSRCWCCRRHSSTTSASACR